MSKIAIACREIFPLLIPIDQFCSQFEGFIIVQGIQFALRISFAKGNASNDVGCFECDEKLTQILVEHRETLHKRLIEYSSNQSSFFIELRELLERLLGRGEKGQGIGVVPPVKYYSRLLSELDEIGWQSLKDVDSSFSTIQISINDSKGRDHLLSLRLGIDYPESVPECLYDLPQNSFQIRWDSKKSTLSDIVRQFKECAEQFDSFWEEMDLLENEVWIVEPQPAPRSATFRRIALGNHSFIHIQIDAKRPRSVPDCKLIGPENSVGPLRETFNKNLGNWSMQKSLKQNLEMALSMQLPSKSMAQKEEMNNECGICYQYRFQNSIPDKVCDNAKCGKAYHRFCLFEWLKALPTSRQSFNTIFGQCTYCSENISVRLVD